MSSLKGTLRPPEENGANLLFRYSVEDVGRERGGGKRWSSDVRRREREKKNRKARLSYVRHSGRKRNV